MASDDPSLIAEVRALTGYTSTNTFSDAEMQELVDIAKQELKAELGLPNFVFHQQNNESFQADRALFWFTCIATKVRAGEIGNIDIEIGEALNYTDSENEYSYWFDQLRKRTSSAASSQGSGGASTTLITRENERTYGDN